MNGIAPRTSAIATNPGTLLHISYEIRPKSSNDVYVNIEVSYHTRAATTMKSHRSAHIKTYVMIHTYATTEYGHFYYDTHAYAYIHIL